MKTIALLQLAGLLQLGLLTAGAAMPRAVSLREHLAGLPPFIRQLFWVYYAFIGLNLAGFGVLSWWCAPDLAAGGVLARALCGFLAVFWAARLGVAAFVFDVRPYLTTTLYRCGHYMINLVFLYLMLVFGWVALRPLP